MKKLSKGIQRLADRAAEIREAVDTLPGKAAELREAVVGAAGSLQHARAEIVSGATALRAGGDPNIAATLREIDAAGDVLAEAGCQLAGVDLDLTGGKRLRVRLDRVLAIDAARLRALLAAHAHQPVLKMLLAGIVQATDAAGNEPLTELEFTELLVDMTTGQAARVGWRATGKEERVRPLVGAASSATLTPSAAEARPPTFSQSSFFERTPVASSAPTTSVTQPSSYPSSTPPPLPGAPVATSPAVPTASAPARASEPIRVSSSATRASALARFKKMPDLTKRSAG